MKTQTSVQLPSHLKLINLKEHYDYDLLREFYYRVMKNNFPLEDELDNLETLVQHLREDSHILETEIAILYDEKTDCVAGGTVYDYYRVANVGLLSYFCLLDDDRYRGLGLGRFLVEYAFCRTQMMANRYNTSKSNRKLRKKMLKVFFAHDPHTLNVVSNLFRRKYFLQKSTKNDMFCFLAETNRLDVNDGVLRSDVRHNILFRIGFRFLDFDYVQAPLNLDADPCHDLVLLTYCPASQQNSPSHASAGTTSTQHTQNNKCGSLRREIILAFITEFGLSVTHDKSFSFRDEPYFTQMEKGLRSIRDPFELKGLPWKLSDSPTSSLAVCRDPVHVSMIM